jgi:hypothetical protein
LTGSMALASEYGTGIYSGKWRLFFTASAGGLDVSGFEIALDAGSGVGIDAMDFTFLGSSMGPQGLGTLNSSTNVQTINETNIVGYDATTDVSTSPFGGMINHESSVRLTAGSSGALWVYLNYDVTSASYIPYRRLVVGHTLEAPVTTEFGISPYKYDFVGWVKVKDVAPVDAFYPDFTITFVMYNNFRDPSLNPFDYTTDFKIHYIYTQTGPVLRQVIIDNAHIFNVCAVG